MKTCSNNHYQDGDHPFCPQCGAPTRQAEPTPSPSPAAETDGGNLPPPAPRVIEKPKARRSQLLVGIVAVLSLLLVVSIAYIVVNIDDGDMPEADESPRTTLPPTTTSASLETDKQPLEGEGEQWLTSFTVIVEIIEEFETEAEGLQDSLPDLINDFWSWHNEFATGFTSTNDPSIQQAWMEDLEMTRAVLDSRTYSAGTTFFDNVLALEARLSAERLVDEGLKELRNSAIAHFSAWAKCGPAQLEALRKIFAAGFDDPVLPLETTNWDATSDDIWTRVADPACENASSSFDTLCISLGDEQPANLTFKERIIDICDD